MTFTKHSIDALSRIRVTLESSIASVTTSDVTLETMLDSCDNDDHGKLLSWERVFQK